MSSYSKFYTSSDVTVFIEQTENGGSIPQLHLDTTMTVGWQENLDSSQVYGIGDQFYGFISAGNLFVGGMIEINFTHENYMKYSIDAVMTDSVPDKTDEQMTKSFFSVPIDLIEEARAENNALIKKRRTANLKSGGIQSYKQGWDLRIMMNNGNFTHNDAPKQFLLKGCKIVSSSLNTSTSSEGQISQVFQFIAREVTTG